MKAINFVSSRQKSLTKKQVVDQKYFYISAGVFGVVVLITLIVLGVQWYVFSKVKTVKQESEILKEQILAGEDKENTFIVLVHKLEAISKVMDERKARQEAVDYFSTVFGNEVLVEEMRYEEDQQRQLLVFKLISKDVFVLEGVLGKLQSQELKEKYPLVKFSDLKRSEKASYSLDVTVSLSQE